jgi:hypothetical protein
LETVVQVPLIPYFGISDSVSRIYKEEGTAPDKDSIASSASSRGSPSSKKRRQRKKGSRSGIAAFYRGFWARWMLLAFTHFAQAMDFLDIQDDP